jgi:serine/threonine-protein kinase
VLAASIGGAGVVGVHDYDVDPDEGPFLVMEAPLWRVARGSPHGRARARHRESLDIALSALGTLAAVHARGVVHRDLKPANVFLAAKDRGEYDVKLLDFGIARVMGGGGSGLTRPGTLLGTPRYMPQEQARGDEELDPRVDLYAVGAILYRAISGVLPYANVPREELVRTRRGRQGRVRGRFFPCGRECGG